MLDIVTTQELEEDLSSFEASVGDLISAEEFFSMVGPTFEFKESLVTAKDIAEMVEARFFKEDRAKAPPAKQMVPMPNPRYAVVFKDYFSCDLCLSPFDFLYQFMEVFHLELHHFTPNRILTLNKFC